MSDPLGGIPLKKIEIPSAQFKLESACEDLSPLEEEKLISISLNENTTSTKDTTDEFE